MALVLATITIVVLGFVLGGLFGNKKETVKNESASS
jgi:hypothetical protein